MAEKNYSYSALSTYETCSLKYDLSYVKHIWLPKVYSYDLTKGIIFHSYAELYKSSPTFSNHRELLAEVFKPGEDVTQAWLNKLTIEDKQKIVNACSEFKDWWDRKFPTTPTSLKRETKLVGKDPFNFTGVIDLYYEDEAGLHIVDYKTSKNCEVKYYKAQLELYSHYLSKSLGKPVADISIYFAFAEGVSGDERLIPVPKPKPEKTSLKYKELLDEILGEHRKAEANLNRLCDYCSYRGHKEYCPVSVIAGAKPPLVPQE